MCSWSELNRRPFVCRRSVSVRVGEHDTATNPDCQNLGGGRECADPVQDIAVAQRIWHAEFDRPIRWANDIGLIRLARRVNIASGERNMLITSYHISNRYADTDRFE